MFARIGEVRMVQAKILMLAASLCVTCSGVQNAVRASRENETTTAQQEDRHDGICKTAQIPPGYVPVGEINSPDCNSRDPFDMNAWELSVAKEGIVTCTLPDYQNGDGTVIRYVACGRRYSDHCPKRIDAGPNGYLLATPMTCEENSKWECVNKLPKPRLSEIVVARDNSSVCPNPTIVPWAPKSSIPYTREKRHEMKYFEYFPVCREFFPSWLAKQSAAGLLDKVLVVRRFYDQNCSSQVPSEPNALVLYRPEITLTPGAPKQKLFACPEPGAAPGRRFHDDKCGVGKERNAIWMIVP
jgi:hypothetical protein